MRARKLQSFMVELNFCSYIWFLNIASQVREASFRFSVHHLASASLESIALIIVLREEIAKDQTTITLSSTGHEGAVSAFHRSRKLFELHNRALIISVQR